MSKDNPSPPPAPDPAATANAQSGSNIATAIANAQLNRVSQATPWGSITYTQGPAGANGVPTWSSQIQLSPQQQQLLEQQQGMQSQRNQIAQGYLGQVGRTLDFSHVAPIQNRGQNYTGAVNAPGNAQSMPVATPPPATPAASSSSSDSALISQILAMLQGGNLGGGTNPLANPGGTPTATATPAPGATPAANASTLDLSKPVWGSSQGMVYQYGHDSSGRDTFGPGTDEAGNPLGNQDGSMIGSQDLRYHDAATALAGNPGYTQLRVAQQGVPGGFKDAKLVKYDPTVGYITPASNIVAAPDDTTARMLMVLAPAVAGIAAGAYAGAGAAGGGEAAAGGAAGDSAAAGAADVGMPGYASEVGSAGASAGAPVTDLSVQAAQPSLGSSMWNNLTSGHGLLGLSPAQRAGVGLLPSLLRNYQGRNNTGGSK